VRNAKRHLINTHILLYFKPCSTAVNLDARSVLRNVIRSVDIQSFSGTFLQLRSTAQSCIVCCWQLGISATVTFTIYRRVVGEINSKRYACRWGRTLKVQKWKCGRTSDGKQTEYTVNTQWQAHIEICAKLTIDSLYFMNAL